LIDGQPMLWAAFNYRTLLATSDFCMCLSRLLPTLDSSDIDRLVRRFDVFGDGVCSTVKFVQVVTRSKEWLHATSNVWHLVECYEQALWALRRGVEDGGMSSDAVNAALGLGIRVSSDADKMWIVHEMLDSPLPMEWEAVEVVEEDETASEKVRRAHTQERAIRAFHSLRAH